MARYIEILFRFQLRFVCLLVLLPLVVGGTTIVLFPSYKAIAQLWVDDPSYFGGTTPVGWNQYLTPAQNEADGLTQLLSTRAFSYDLYNHLSNDIPDASQRLTAVSNAKVSIVPIGSHLIMITATCEQKPVCAQLINRSVEVLRDEQVADERANAQSGQAYLSVQLQQARTDQAAAEDALRRYIVTHPGTKVDTSADPTTIADPELSRLATTVQQARGHANDLQAQVDRNSNIVSASTAVIQTLPRMVDSPVLTHGWPIGDGTGLRKGAIAGGAALAAGLVYLFLLGFVDKTLRDPRDIEHRFKVPVVTTIPELQPSERF